AGVFVKTHVIDGGPDLYKLDVLPLQAQYLQGASPIEGQPMLIECWATWCQPCRQSISHLNQIHAQYKSRGLQAIGITDEADAPVPTFLHTVPVNYTVALDQQHRFTKALNVDRVPTAFLVNSEGKVVWRGHPADLPTYRLESLLTEK